MDLRRIGVSGYRDAVVALYDMSRFMLKLDSVEETDTYLIRTETQPGRCLTHRVWTITP